MGGDGVTTITIRASSLPGYAECSLRAAVGAMPTVFAEHGHFLARPMANIGALVGSGVHGAAEVALREKMQGVETALDVMSDAGIAAFRERLAADAETGLTLDKDSPTTAAAERQIVRMVRVVRESIVAEANPIMVESRIVAELRPGVLLSGQGDLLHLDGGHAFTVRRIRDLKTGRTMGPAGKHDAQIGSYSLLYRSRGHDTDTAQIDFVPRVRGDKDQPGVIVNARDIRACERLAWAVLNEFADKGLAFAADGNPSRFLPNPNSRLCSARFCRAHGTKTCSATNEG